MQKHFPRTSLVLVTIALVLPTISVSTKVCSQTVEPSERIFIHVMTQLDKLRSYKHLADIDAPVSVVNEIEKPAEFMKFLRQNFSTKDAVANGKDFTYTSITGLTLKRWGAHFGIFDEVRFVFEKLKNQPGKYKISIHIFNQSVL